MQADLVYNAHKRHFTVNGKGVVIMPRRFWLFTGFIVVVLGVAICVLHLAQAAGKTVWQATIGLPQATLQMAKALWDATPSDFRVPLLVAILGAGGWLIKTWRENRIRLQARRERVAGLLAMGQFEAQHGAEQGTEVYLESLQALFSEENLYRGLHDLGKRHRGLTAQVRGLWQAARSHNAGLAQPGAAMRAAMLLTKANKLKETLKELGVLPQ
jgi:hypothetical protein